MLALRGVRVTALEPDNELADVLERRTHGLDNVRVLRDAAEDIEAGLGADSAICFNVLEHIADHESAIRKIGTLLRPRGQLLVLSPAHPFLFGATDRAVDHERRYTRRGLGSLLAGNGYDVAEVRYVNPVGAAGWLVSSRLLGRKTLPRGPLQIYERVIPALRLLDRLRLRFGLSVWCRGVRRD